MSRIVIVILIYTQTCTSYEKYDFLRCDNVQSCRIIRLFVKKKFSQIVNLAKKYASNTLLAASYLNFSYPEDVGSACLRNVGNIY
jgi:hypothetical protein